MTAPSELTAPPATTSDATQDTGSARRAAPRRWRPPEADPSWVRPAVIVLLAATAVLYLWRLGDSQWANAYYSAAAQAGSVSWKAFLFGSSDAANSITVDKTPLSLWPMALTVRVFGLDYWSVLVPQALEGVATVGLLYLTVKRWFGPAAGLLAGAALALTPAAVLMFRFNNPDALLMLLLVASVYFTTRAIEDGRTRWILAAGAMIGLGFLTKELQAFLVVPVLAGTYLFAGPPKFARRFVQCIWMGVATLVAGGWWVAIVSVWPASDRPYFGGSQNNTFWNVLFGYNGLGRITGNEAGSVTRGGVQGGPGSWGPTGLTRLFDSSFGGQASWLIPAALLALTAGLIWTLRRPRTDRTRAALLLWGGWLVVTGVVFSLSKGIIHEYYTVALAPAIGALVGIGAVEAWRRRDHVGARVLLASGTLLSTGWAFVLLDRTPKWWPWLRWTVLVGGVIGAVALFVVDRPTSPERRRWIAASVVTAVLAVTFAGTAAYAIDTAATPHAGSLPVAGPRVPGSRGGPQPPGGPGGPPPPGAPRPAPPGAPPPDNARQRAGSLLQGSVPGPELTALLQRDAESFEWTAATIGANRASGYQLASEYPVMPIGGFNGSDPNPSLTEFQRLVADGRIHWYIAGADPADEPRPAAPAAAATGPGAPPGPKVNKTARRIARWVRDNFTSRVVDGIVVYDLTSPADGGSASDR